MKMNASKRLSEVVAGRHCSSKIRSAKRTAALKRASANYVKKSKR